MTKSELIETIASKQSHLTYSDVEISVKTLLEKMSQTLASGGRIEIRGFGIFTVRTRAPRIGRNPKTGEMVPIPTKHALHFKPSRKFNARVNAVVNTQEN